jgi:protein Tex
VVKAGQVVKVKVVEVDAKRNRVALTMRLNDTAVPRAGNANANSNPSTVAAPRQKSAQSARPALGSAPAASQSSAMAAAFAKLKKQA